ncbi:hypothetical protein A2369_03200 [candidate division WS6 bacterium RIFOXYB1_FULL_33_15]|nr:MAG: hypothetical protein A2369_03200 [candidate division WS6 bacterium RIFOXYB1_FULL_33_15]
MNINSTTFLSSSWIKIFPSFPFIYPNGGVFIYVPCSAEACLPLEVLSFMFSISNSAITPMIPNIALPNGVEVSILSLAERNSIFSSPCSNISRISNKTLNLLANLSILYTATTSKGLFIDVFISSISFLNPALSPGGVDPGTPSSIYTYCSPANSKLFPLEAIKPIKEAL